MSKKRNRRLLITEEGNELLLTGKIQVQLGKGEMKIKEEHDLDHLSEKEFEKFAKNPVKYKFDKKTGKIKLRDKNRR